MNTAKTILTLLLFTICAVSGNEIELVIHVGGDVPKPGPVSYKDKGMTIDAAMAGVGMDLTPYYQKGHSVKDGQRCPIRVEIFNQSEKTTYDPRTDSAVMRAHALMPNDTISVTDIRQHPKKIEVRKQRIERMLELGSTEIADELLSLAAMQREYEEWRSGAASKGSVDYFRKEAARLVEEGKGQKIIGILELKLSAQQLEGLGSAHPLIKQTKDLIAVFRELVAK